MYEMVVAVTSTLLVGPLQAELAEAAPACGPALRSAAGFTGAVPS